jgi:hypothetical protein
MSDELVTFGPEGADTGTDEGADTEQQGAEGQEEKPREPHSRTRAHAADGRFDGPAPKPPEKKPEPEPKPEPKKEPEKPAAPARLKFKVPKDDGSGEEDVELTPEEAGRRLAEARQLARARDEERQERQKAEKEATAFRRLTEGLKNGKDRAQLMRNFVRESGLSPEEAEDFFAEALHGEMTEKKLTPEQKRLRELEEREAQREEQERTEKAEAEFVKHAETVRAKEAEYSKVWGEALAKSGLPQTPALLADIARHHLVNRKRGLTLTADELVGFATGELDRSLDARAKGLTPEQFAKRFPELAKAQAAHLEDMEPEALLKAYPKLGPKLLKHFREKARARSQPGVGATRPPAPRAAPTQPEAYAPVRYDEWSR